MKIAGGIIFAVIVGVVSGLHNRPDDTIDILNRCLETESHKIHPTPEEDLLEGHCAPWTNRSCCTKDVAEVIHYGNLYNFRYEHCPTKKMSERCKAKFLQNHCFYECSPNVGPWIKKVNMKIRNETFVDVPLCKTDCDSWFDACKNDFTCIDNWTKFSWERIPGEKGKWNVCPKGTKCKPFSEIFQNSQQFCERIWDNSYKYTPDDQPCMRMSFEGSAGNPNDQVALWKVGQDEVNSASLSSIYSNILYLTGFAVIAQIYSHC